MNCVIEDFGRGQRMLPLRDFFRIGKPPALKILIYQRMWNNRSKLSVSGCKFMFNRARWREADAVVFHVPQLKYSCFPPRKLQGQIWVAWSMESEVLYPMLARRNELDKVFDLWMTYQQDSDICCSYLEPGCMTSLLLPPVEKNTDVLVAAVISSRVEQSGRTVLLDGLMREMPIDSYGKLFCNRPGQMKPGRAGKLAVISRYKFTLAFENSICRDYVTEKFFDPLVAGSVPVYLGAPNVDDFAPGDNCYINASQFSSPRALAAYLIALANDEAAYARYFEWKTKTLRPRFLQLMEASKTGALQRLAERLLTLRSATNP